MTKKRTSALAAATVVLLSLGGCSSAPEKPETMTELPECGWLPHCVNTQSGEGVHAAPPLEAAEPKWLALKDWLSKQSNWHVVSDDGNFMQLTVKTPTVGFTDDVQLLFLPQQQLIQVRSSSRLGISDLGTNARRVETLRKELENLD